MATILLVHIITMSASVVVSVLMGLTAAAGRYVNCYVVRAALTATSVGVASGTVLLMQQPLNLKCAVLFAYVLVFTAVYVFVTRQNQSLVGSES